jgi:hypothetical protein
MAGLPLPDMSALIRDGHLPFFRCGGKLLRNPLAALSGRQAALPLANRAASRDLTRFPEQG